MLGDEVVVGGLVGFLVLVEIDEIFDDLIDLLEAVVAAFASLGILVAVCVALPSIAVAADSQRMQGFCLGGLLLEGIQGEPGLILLVRAVVDFLNLLFH